MNLYVLMFTDNGRAMFQTTTRKRIALKRARAIGATVYAIPTQDTPPFGWDCPTIRAVFDPIYEPA